jgi:[ribosomal protein S5]-alanine N-acetyltransferase
MPFDPPNLELKRIRLRQLRETDIPAVFAMYSDPETARYLSHPPLKELGHAAKIVATALAGYADGTSLHFAIERIADRAFLGICLLFHFQKASRRAEIGYTLAREHWSQGYMTEALGAFIAHAFGPLGLERLEADIDPRNAASARILERLGFVREGLLRSRWIVAGEKSDSAIYGLLRSDWLAP